MLGPHKIIDTAGRSLADGMDRMWREAGHDLAEFEQLVVLNSLRPREQGYTVPEYQRSLGEITVERVAGPIVFSAPGERAAPQVAVAERLRIGKRRSQAIFVDGRQQLLGG